MADDHGLVEKLLKFLFQTFKFIKFLLVIFQYIDPVFEKIK